MIIYNEKYIKMETLDENFLRQQYKIAGSVIFYRVGIQCKKDVEKPYERGLI